MTYTDEILNLEDRDAATLAAHWRDLDHNACTDADSNPEAEARTLLACGMHEDEVEEHGEQAVLDDLEDCCRAYMTEEE